MKPIPIGGIINQVLESCRRKYGEPMEQVCMLWNSLLEKSVVENTRPKAIKGSLLLVHVSSSTWRHQLRFLKKDIIATLNSHLEQTVIEDIKFKIGAL